MSEKWQHDPAKEAAELGPVIEEIEARRPTRSRGRPAQAPEQPEDPEGFAGLQRRSRRFGASNDFEIPDRLLRKYPQWDFQWMTISIMGQPTDPSELVGYMENHWTPVDAAWMKELLPPGWEGRTIERRGMRLYKRPLRLSVEAKKEDYAIAKEQKDNKLASALATPAGTAQRTLTDLDTGIQPLP